MIKDNRFSVREIVGILLLALLLAMSMKDPVNQLTESMLPTVDITISALNNDGNRNVTIVYEGNDNELFNELKLASELNNTGWEYVEGEVGVRWTSLTLTPNDTQVTIKAKVSPRMYLTAFGNRDGGIIDVQIPDGKSVTMDCYKDQDEIDLLRIYPFEHNKTIFIIKAALYIVLTLILFSAFILIDYAIKYLHVPVLRSIGKYFHKPIRSLDFWICWLGLFLLAVYIYKVPGIPNYLQVGDEEFYWNSQLLNNGKWDVLYLSEKFAPRGYWCYVPQTIARYIGKWLSVDACVVWMLLPSLMIAWLSTGIFPGLYRELTGQEAKKLHILPVIVVMLTTWRDCLTAVGPDIFGVVFLFASFYYTIKCSRSLNLRAAILAGITGAIAGSLRAANIIGVVAVAVYEIIIADDCGIIKQITQRKHLKTKTRTGKIVLCGLAGLASFIVICLPQLQINLCRGHVGLFPYDHDQAWFGRSLTTWSSDVAMTYGNQSYPVLVTDDQMLTMKNAAYNRATPLTMEQLLDTYAESPVESAMLILKKIVIGFDKKTNIAYPDPGPGVPWRDTPGILFSLWNYFVLFSALFAVTRKNTLTKEEKTLGIIIFVALVLPETFMKIEWRYIFAGYIALYYCFAFHFVGDAMEKADERRAILQESNYLAGLAIFSFLYLTCSFTLLA